jgi:hypothetical protein
VSSYHSDEDSIALKRAKRRLKRQITYLALMLAAALVAKHYVVGHLEESARTMAEGEARARAEATFEVGGQTAQAPSGP